MIERRQSRAFKKPVVPRENQPAFPSLTSGDSPNARRETNLARGIEFADFNQRARHAFKDHK
jgi:hypothetical protein